MNKVIFIDRDGVINEDLWGYVKRPEDFRFIPGVLPALRKLADAGYKILIISNQAGVGDGEFEEEDLDAVTEFMMKALILNKSPASGVFYCMHGKAAGCSCRKPRTGLFEKAADAFDFDPAETWFIGDKVTDIEAGRRFGLKTILVKTGYGAKEMSRITEDCRPEHIDENLAEAVKRVLGGQKGKGQS